MEFQDKVVLITGGSGGIGSEAAQLFSREGAGIALVDLHPEELQAMAARLHLPQENTELIAADVADEESVRRYVAQTMERFGRIDVFINNAGTEGSFALIKDHPAENLSRVLDINVKGVFFGMKHVIPIMINQKGGVIINTASVAGLIGSPGLAPYVASKHAVLGLTKTAALECAMDGIRVLAVNPGPVDNRMMRSIEAGASPENPEAVHDQFEQQIPLRRYCQSHEVAQFMLFLASSRASYLTGTYYMIDGGMMAN